MARVIVITPDKTQTNHRLVKRITTIGRTPANQIQIHDGAASRKHCLIKLIGESFSLVDLGSANGTVVNGDRVKEIDLSDGDRIKIGKTILAFKED